MAYDLAEMATAYDALTAKVKDDLKAEFDARRIKGTEYADVYEKLLSTCLQLAFNSVLTDKQIDLVTEQVKSEQDKQLLTERQIKGFDDNVNMKMTEMQMNAWSVMFSSGLLEDKPDIVSSDALSQLYYELIAKVNNGKSIMIGDTSVEQLSVTKFVILNYNSSYTYEIKSSDVNWSISNITNNSFEVTALSNAKDTTLTMSVTDTNGITYLDFKKVNIIT